MWYVSRNGCCCTFTPLIRSGRYAKFGKSLNEPSNIGSSTYAVASASPPMRLLFRIAGSCSSPITSVPPARDEDGRAEPVATSTSPAHTTPARSQSFVNRIEALLLFDSQRHLVEVAPPCVGSDAFAKPAVMDDS